MLFINGFFWQKNRFPFIGHSTTLGAAVMLKEINIQTYFSGVVGGVVNQTIDHYGQAVISDLTIKGENMSFTKKYNHREDFIYYKFEKSLDQKFWVGNWSGSAVGEGRTRCVLSEVPVMFSNERAF